MKNYLGFLICAVAFLLASCSKETTTTEPGSGDDNSRMSVKPGNSGDLISMDDPFQLDGKAANISYAYKAYANQPVINGTSTEATSVVSVGNWIFVSWHTESTPYGGAISAYEFTGSGYVYREVLETYDTDWHDVKAELNGATNTVSLYMAGQRNPDSSNYFLAGHKGAVAAKIDFITNGNPKFQLSTLAELPLQGFATNSVAIDSTTIPGSVLAISGNGTGSFADTTGLYRIPKDFSNVLAVQEVDDGLYIENDNYSFSGNKVYLNRNSSDLELYGLAPGASVNSGVLFQTISPSSPLIDRERISLAWCSSDSIVVAGGPNGLYAVDVATGLYNTHFLGSSVIDVTVDSQNELIYVAAADGGVHVLAGLGYNGGVLINPYDLIGKFTPPTGGPFPANYYAKDVSLYLGDNITIATGSAGVFFVEKL